MWPAPSLDKQIVEAMGVKYAVTLASFKDLEPIEKTLARISPIGFDAVEVYGEPDLLNAGKLRGELGKFQTDVCGITGVWGASARSGNDRLLLTSDNAKLKSAEKYVRDCVKLCAELGGRHMNVCLFADTELSVYEKTHLFVAPETKLRIYKHALPTLKGLATFAHEYGVSLFLEPLNRYSTPFCSSAQDALAVSDMLGVESFGVMLDTFHMNIEEDSFDRAIRLSGKRLRHVHLADNNRKMPGFAHIDFSTIIRALDGINYSGYMTFEPTIASADGYEDSLKKGLQFIQSLSKQSSLS
jgi:sugar phosphate isomerase/epimerase